jgi:thioesterase
MAAITLSPAQLRWLPHRRPAMGKPRLFAFPYAGGGAAQMHRWLAPLADMADLCAVQLPGREERRSDPAFRDLADAVLAIADALDPLLEDGTPAFFFGHSMGALVAYELAGLLHQRQKTPPRHLILSAMAPPHAPDRVPPLHELPRPAAIAALAEMGGTPQAILDEPDLLDLLLPTIQADIALVRSRKRDGGLVLPVSITCFAGDGDPLAPLDDIRHWRRYGDGAFAERVFAGAHFFLHDRPAEVLAAIRAILRPPTAAP